MILGLLDEAVSSGARWSKACEALGVDRRTIQRWKRQDVGDDRRAGPLKKPANALSEAERAHVLDVVTSPQYRDKSPKQIVPLLADQGEYIASEKTIYRILHASSMATYRAIPKAPSKRHRPAPLHATGPNQVWSWDITYVQTTVRGIFYYLYMVMDIWSRKIVGFEVFDRECSELAAWLIQATYRAEGVAEDQLSLHADNGGPMKGATMLAMLQKLEVMPSFSRPSVSNDNPYSESLFRTAKYRPDYPSKPFDSVEAARTWAAHFVSWYNHEHLHSSIGFVTPNDRHEGKSEAIMENRKKVYEAAKAARPERWRGGVRNWEHITDVTLNPTPDEELHATA